MNGNNLAAKVFLAGAVAVLALGLVLSRRDGMPVLKASGSAVRPIVSVDAGLRDAVASPALSLAGASGWLQAVAEAASMSRPVRVSVPVRPTSGRAAFTGGRVIVDGLTPGI